MLFVYLKKQRHHVVNEKKKNLHTAIKLIIMHVYLCHVMYYFLFIANVI